MKKCPNCQKTYDDNLKFCQADGTPLVAVAEDVPEENPFKTTVAKKEDLPVPPEKQPEPPKPADPFATMVAGEQPPRPVKPELEEEDVLEVPKEPELDPLKTMVVSGDTASKLDVQPPASGEQKEAPKAPPAPEPPPAKPSVPEPPKILESEPPKAPPTPEPPKPSPPAAEPKPPAPEPPKPEASKPAPPPPSSNKPPTPIPSPFEDSMPPGFTPPETPPFEVSEEPIQPETRPEPEHVAASNPEPALPEFDEPEAGAVEPEEFGATEDFSLAESEMQMEPSDSEPPAAGGESPNMTMGYISLGLGILSMLCCVSIITGPAAIITGFMARGREAEDPQAYGGGTYGLIGMIAGVIGTILFIVLMIVQFFFVGLQGLNF